MIKEKIDKDLITAMKAHDENIVTVLRMLKSAIKNIEIAKQKDLEDAEVMSVIQNQIKTRRDSIDLYVKGNRPELAESEKAEIEILTPYLPEQLSEEEIKTIVEKVIAETSASSMKDMGKVMGLAMAELKGKADSTLVSQIVKDTLSN